MKEILKEELIAANLDALENAILTPQTNYSITTPVQFHP
jgi:hypothetical protein